MGRQKAGLALDGGIGCRGIGHPEHRKSAEFDHGVFVIDHPLFVLVDDLCCTNLPQGGLLRVILTRFARRIGPLFENGRISVNALGMRSGETGFIRAQDAQ